MKTLEPATLSVDIGGSELRYLYYAGGDSTIIMMHATGFMPWMWHPIARELAGEYTIIAPYFCDHRTVEPEDGGLAWMLLAEDLCGLCKQLDVKEPLLVGHSMGATVMTLANAAHGTIAKKMVLIEPIFLPEDFYRVSITVDQHPLASKSIKRKNFWENTEEARAYLRSRELFRRWDDEMLDIYINRGMTGADSGGLQLVCSPRSEASLFMGGMKYDPWPLLPGIHCPVLVVEGEKSENRSFIDLKKASSLFPKGSYLLIEEAGHLIPMEKPAVITGVIKKFFNR